jgi:hypothetical protein
MQVTETLGPAWNRMKETLFRPFNLGTWFSWGFIFALQSCVEGGGGCNFNVPSGNSGGSGGTHHYNNNNNDTNDAIAGAGRHLLDSMSNAFSGSHAARGGADDFDPDMLIGIGIAAVIVMIPLMLFMYWIGARGQMMAIRSVAIGRADVGESWNAVKNAGGSFFKFHLVVLALGLVVFVPVLAGAGVVMYPMVKDGLDSGPESDVFARLLPVLIGFAVVIFVLAIPFMILNGLARNFVAPIMLKYDIGSREAWKRFWAVGKNHLGGIAIFFVLRMVFAGLAGVVGVIGGFLTCCLGFLPVLHQTLMAPYYFFERMWTLEILASMSPDFDLRNAAPQGPQGGFGGPPPGYYGGPGYTPGMNPYTPPGGGGAPPPPGGFGGPGY